MSESTSGSQRKGTRFSSLPPHNGRQSAWDDVGVEPDAAVATWSSGATDLDEGRCDGSFVVEKLAVSVESGDADFLRCHCGRRPDMVAAAARPTSVPHTGHAIEVNGHQER